jgi:hypothetical protein
VTGGGLLLLMLLVSWSSLLLQAAALVHLVRQRAGYAAEQLAGGGYVRTAACRVAAAAVYVTVAVLDAAGVQVPGAGGVSAEALVVLTAVQLLWLSNSALDIRLRRRLKREEPQDRGGSGAS